MLTLLYFLFGPLLILTAIIVADASGDAHRPRRDRSPSTVWYLGFLAFGVTVVGLLATVGTATP